MLKQAQPMPLQQHMEMQHHRLEPLQCLLQDYLMQPLVRWGQHQVLLQESMQKVYSAFQVLVLEIRFQQCLSQEKLLYQKKTLISMDHYSEQLEMIQFQGMQLDEMELVQTDQIFLLVEEVMQYQTDQHHKVQTLH